MAGLHDMAPTVANRCVTSAVLAPHGRRRGGITAGMAAANHDNVEFVRMAAL